MERHHVLFSRKMWAGVNKNARHLRQTPQLIPPVEHDAHVELHKRVPIVPLLDDIMLSEVARRFVPEDNFVDSVESLMFAITEVSHLQRMTNIEQRLGALTVYALEEQRPYIRYSRLPDGA